MLLALEKHERRFEEISNSRKIFSLFLIYERERNYKEETINI